MLKKIKNKKNIALGEEEVLSLISKDSYSLKKLSRKLKLKTEKEDSILSEILEKLEAKGKILKTRDKQYKILKKAVYVTGRVDYVSARFAFIISEEMEQDVWVNAKDLSYALDGDIVKVLLFEEKEKKKRQASY
jgi:exoribonuclease R